MYYKIMLSFLALGIIQMIILIMGSIASQNNAASYFEERMTERYESAAKEAMSVLASNGWTLNDQGFVNYFDGYTLRHDVRLKILDLNQQVIYTNLTEEQGLSRSLDNNKTNNNFRANQTVRTELIDLVVDDEKVGTMVVLYYEDIGPKDKNYFDRMSEVFRNTIISTILMTLLASFFVARSITLPLKKVSNTALRISNGHLDARADVATKTTEIYELSESINNLGATLSREDALRKQVTSDMAHEIRTPLTALRNFFEAFIDGVYEPNESNMMKCHDEVLRMSELVDRLKELATIEEENIHSSKERVCLSEEIAIMCELLQPEYDKKSMTLTYKGDEGIHLYMNRNHLRQIISNLLTNANHYSDEGTKVHVTAIVVNEQVFIKIKDQGIGMSEEDCHNIFERFYRADKSRDRSTGGMGVGLTIVKTLVESYNGTISVESKLGIGTTFEVVLPMID